MRAHPFVSWFNNPRVRLSAILLLAAIVLVEGYFAIFVRRNDILCHRAMGEDFLAGDPYGFPTRQVYPLPRLMMNVALAIGPVYVTRAVCYALAVCALYVVFRCWRTLAPSPPTPLPQGEGSGMTLAVAAALVAAATALPFLLRDLDECGLQIFLLFMLSVAGFALARRRALACGFCLATAAAYKVTPFLFLPFLLWKRQWQAAAWMAVFIGGWFLAPAVYLGWDKTIDCHKRWLTTSYRIATAKQAYPSQLEFEQPMTYNLSFAALAARYLETHPENHPLYISHPAFFQFGDLDGATAYYCVRGLTLLLGLALAWRFFPSLRSGSRQTSDADAYGTLASSATNPMGRSFAYEWAAMCLLCALLAPVCWKQHLVVILPALYLVWHSVLATNTSQRLRLATLAVVALIFIGTRHFVLGKALALVAMSYKFDTMGVLLVLFLVLRIPTKAQIAVESIDSVPLARAA